MQSKDGKKGTQFNEELKEFANDKSNGKSMVKQLVASPLFPNKE